MADLEQRLADPTSMVGSTPAEQQRLARYQQWKERARREVEGEVGEYASQATNTRNVPYMSLIAIAGWAIKLASRKQTGSGAGAATGPAKPSGQDLLKFLHFLAANHVGRSASQAQATMLSSGYCLPCATKASEVVSELSRVG
eukprot:76331-Amphidinium_carterae.1